MEKKTPTPPRPEVYLKHDWRKGYLCMFCGATEEKVDGKSCEGWNTTLTCQPICPECNKEYMRQLHSF